VDSFVFFYNLYTITKDDEKDDDNLITAEELDTFKLCCVETLKHEKSLSNKPRGSKVNFVKLNKSLQKKFRINHKIFELVYANFDA
jgi:hypothetical protein